MAWQKERISDLNCMGIKMSYFRASPPSYEEQLSLIMDLLNLGDFKADTSAWKPVDPDTFKCITKKEISAVKDLPPVTLGKARSDSMLSGRLSPVKGKTTSRGDSLPLYRRSSVISTSTTTTCSSPGNPKAALNKPDSAVSTVAATEEQRLIQIMLTKSDLEIQTIMKEYFSVVLPLN